VGDPIRTAAAVFHLANFYKAKERQVTAYRYSCDPYQSVRKHRYADTEEQLKKMVLLAEKVQPSANTLSPRGSKFPLVQVHMATALLHLADFYFFFGRYIACCEWIHCSYAVLCSVCLTPFCTK